ncbi:hypothetical protein FDECE_7346 [Fusarium decemcellulare]|nr:hypothetical protein FDECE_7346 [Fusarium decemcellulare]
MAQLAPQLGDTVSPGGLKEQGWEPERRHLQRSPPITVPDPRASYGTDISITQSLRLVSLFPNHLPFFQHSARDFPSSFASKLVPKPHPQSYPARGDTYPTQGPPIRPRRHRRGLRAGLTGAMEPAPATIIDGGNSNPSIAGYTSIELDFSRWNDPVSNSWELKEQKREERRDAFIYVLQWLHQVPSSRPAQGTIINSQSLHARKRLNNEVVDRVDDVFSRSSRAATSKGKPSSVQTTTASAITALRAQSPSASIVVSSIEELLRDSRPAFLPFESASTSAGRKSRYNDTGNHDEGRPPETGDQAGWQASSSALPGPQTRGVEERPATHSGRNQVHWSLGNISAAEAVSSSKEAPKRRNSRLTDDEAASRRSRQKRHRTGPNSRSWGRASPAASGSVNSPRVPTSHLPGALSDTPGRSRRRPQREFSSSHDIPGPSPLQHGGIVQSSEGQSFTEEAFAAAFETCFFWLYTPDQYSSLERHACRGRKEEISHIITHAADHHGLVRGRDPRYKCRKYLTRCQRYNPVDKAKGACGKCSSVHEWKDADFLDREHSGIVLCLRCWQSFTKERMKEHMAGPLCEYKAEQPKARKMWILYTTFCSTIHPPSSAPALEAPRHVHGSPAAPIQPTRSSQQAGGQSTPQQSSGMTSRRGRLRSLQPTRAPKKRPASRARIPSPSSHSRLRSQETMQPPHTPTQRQPQPPNPSFSQSQSLSIAEQSTARPIIGYLPSSEPLPPGFTVLPPEMFHAMQQEISQSTQPCHQTTTFSATSRQPNLHDQSSQHGTLQRRSQQQASPEQSKLLQPIQHQRTQRPLQQPLQPSLLQSSLHRFPQQITDQSQQPDLLLQPPKQHQSNTLPLHTGLRSPLTQPSFLTSPQVSFFGNQDERFLEEHLSTIQQESIIKSQSAPGTDDLAAAMPFSGTLPSQASPSQGSLTFGEQSASLYHSPGPNDSLWPDLDADNTCWLDFNFMGSHPDLLASVDPVEAPPRQHINRPQDLSPESQIPFGLQAAVENDSGYYSNQHEKPYESEFDNIFDFERACSKPEGCL